MTNYEDDIPAHEARAAHAGTSFVPEERAEQERASYPPYETTNNGANIRRMTERLVGLERAKATPATEQASATTGIRVEDSPAENRVRIFYPGKPSADVRARLKRGGFRWAPTLGCWQAYRNTATLALAASEIGEVK